MLLCGESKETSKPKALRWNTMKEIKGGELRVSGWTGAHMGWKVRKVAHSGAPCGASAPSGMGDGVEACVNSQCLPRARGVPISGKEGC